MKPVIEVDKTRDQVKEDVRKNLYGVMARQRLEGKPDVFSFYLSEFNRLLWEVDRTSRTWVEKSKSIHDIGDEFLKEFLADGTLIHMSKRPPKRLMNTKVTVADFESSKNFPMRPPKFRKPLMSTMKHGNPSCGCFRKVQSLSPMDALYIYWHQDEYTIKPGPKNFMHVYPAAYEESRTQKILLTMIDRILNEVELTHAFGVGMASRVLEGTGDSVLHKELKAINPMAYTVFQLVQKVKVDTDAGRPLNVVLEEVRREFIKDLLPSLPLLMDNLHLKEYVKYAFEHPDQLTYENIYSRT